MLNYSANGPSGYNLTNSLRIRNSASAYLERTPSTTSGNQIFTVSFWVKRGLLGVNTGAGQNIFFAFQDGSNADAIGFDASDRFQIPFFDGGAYNIFLATTQVFRDPSAWYHIVVAIDTTQATASNRAKIYVNGNQITSFSTATYPSQNATFAFNKNVLHVLGAGYYFGYSSYSDLYLTEINWITGQALTPSSFGNYNSVTGVWQPAKYTGTYGTNGFYLPFTDIALTSGSNAGLGKDFSGNGNYWNTTNISVTAGTTYDAMIDVPTLTSLTVANYCVLNPLNKDTSITVTNGNLAASAGGTNIGVTGSFAISSGKWYWEITQTAGGVATSNIIGITDSTLPAKTAGLTTNSYGYGTGTTAFKWNAGTNTAYGANWTNGDVISVAFDADAGTITFYKNNVSQGTAFTGISGTFYPAFGFQNTSAYAVNFGQRPFAYTPPSGYLALNAFNLPSSTIPKGNTVMNAILKTGTASAFTVSSLNFKPDFLWAKSRATAFSNLLIDSVRGGDSYLVSDANSAEVTGQDAVTSWNSNGYTGGTLGGSFNANGDSEVNWLWQAGQGTTSSNTSGTITSTVSVNATAGFSIVSFAYPAVGGQTIGHGLGVAPKMIFLKSRSTATLWVVYHASTGNTGYFSLNTSDAFSTNITVWNNTSPTSSVFTLGSGFTSAGYGANGIAYCWAEIAGFSKFTSYTGNGSADGPFVYCNFRPKFVMIKRTVNAGGSWAIYDSARNTYNVANLSLYPNLSSADDTYDVLDFTSNGFKIRTSSLGVNQSGDTFIVAAFAENPFKNALAR